MAECINFTEELQNTPVVKLRDRLERASAGLLLAVVTDTIRDMARYQGRIGAAEQARDRAAYHVEKLEEMIVRATGQKRTSPPKDESPLALE